MGMRIVIGVLWFFAVAYGWNWVALIAGVSELPGLVLGTLAAVLFAVDPLHRVWSARRPAAAAPTAPAAATPASAGSTQASARA